MTFYQTNRAIKTLRQAAYANALPMALHEQITKTLIDLLRHRDQLKKVELER